MNYESPLKDLIDHFRRFQGIGAKSAQRFAFQVLSWQKSEVLAFAESLKRACEEISLCPQCFNFSLKNQLCEICTDNKRNKNTICIIASARELTALERTGEYKALYHVLHGLISPLDGIGAEQLKIKELLNRISENNIEEVIIALNASTEGEATTLYLVRLLKDLVPKISRLAFGLSVGSEIEQTDELTLSKALKGRQIC